MIIAILSENGHSIGLFEHIRIFQDDSTLLHVMKSVRGHMRQWVRPTVELVTCNSDTVSSDIRVIGGESVHIDRNATLWSHQLFNAVLSKLPYTVSFWEQQDSFQVFSLVPGHFIPWSSTIQSEVGIHNIRRYGIHPIHFRLQNRPLPELAEDSICAITLQPITKNTAYWLPCGHVFSYAILRALTSDERCPLCRRPTLLEDVGH